MAHHHSAKKKIRQDEVRRLRNRYYAVTMRNAVRKIRATKEKEEAQKEAAKAEQELSIDEQIDLHSRLGFFASESILRTAYTTDL